MHSFLQVDEKLREKQIEAREEQKREEAHEEELRRLSPQRMSSFISNVTVNSKPDDKTEGQLQSKKIGEMTQRENEGEDMHSGRSFIMSLEPCIDYDANVDMVPNALEVVMQ